MGFSKKKSKNFQKAQKRTGAKAKEKAKKSRQIEARSKVLESKRKAAAITGKAGDRKPSGVEPDVLAGIKSVDDLFAKVGGDGEDPDVSDDESSAGAFHDVGDGSDDDGEAIGPLEDDDDEDAGKRHEQDLRAIKEKDPEFYKFLVEQDKSLLDFRAPERDDEGDEEGGEEEEAEEVAEAAEAQAASPSRLLTSERFGRIKETARESFTSCKAALNAYHAAVRSIEKTPEVGEGPDEEEDDGQTGKSAVARRRRKRKALLQIDNEATFSEVLEWAIANLLGVLEQHAGELKMKGLGAGKQKGKKGKKGGDDDDAEEAAPGRSLVDPTLYTRWLRVKVLAQIFWEETVFLLNHLTAQHLVEFVLRSCSKPESLVWIWPFKSLRSRMLKRCCALWSSASSHSVRLLAFLLIRNSAAMTLHAPEGGSKETAQLEVLTRNVLRTFADTASGGYSWRALSTFRFMENCTVELLTLEDATSYRVGYVWVRQLALILRNAAIATSQGGEAAKAGSSEKSKKKGVMQKQAQSLVSWPFVRSLYLWTKAVGSVKALRPLSYPLAMITMGAVKAKLTNLQHFPFVFHCLQCLNKMASSMEIFVPVSSYILKALGVLLQAMDKAHRKKGPQPGQPAKGFGGTKAPEVEVLLRFSEAQLSEVLALETMGSSLCSLLTDHLGLLSQSPAFPEVSALVVLHLRKYSKHCRSEPLRRQLKTLVEKAELTADDVRARREQLSEAPSTKKFLVFEPDSVLAKARAEQLRRRQAEERGRVEAEMREAAKEKGGSKEEKAKGGGKGKAKAAKLDDIDSEEEKEEEEEEGQAGAAAKAEKRKRKKERKKAKAAAEADEAPKAAAKRRKVLAKQPKGDQDVVEELNFDD